MIRTVLIAALVAIPAMTAFSAEVIDRRSPLDRGAQMTPIPVQSKTCTGEGGRPQKAGTKWCRAGEEHECNGNTGEWVNTRKKCTK